MKPILAAVLAAMLAASARGDEVVFADVVFEAVDIVQFQDIQVQGVAGANAQLQAVISQLQPVLAVEISFAKRAADLNDEQLAKVVAACSEELQELAEGQANGGARAVRGVAIQVRAALGMNARQNVAQDPRQSLVKQVADSVKEVASEEQWKAYQQELTARDDFQKESTIAQMLTMYDEVLLFTPEQRDKIQEALESNWEVSWAQNVEALQQYGNQYYPVIPDNVITKHLTAKQRLRWQSLQKVNATIGLGANNMWGANVIADVQLKAAAPVAEKQAE